LGFSALHLTPTLNAITKTSLPKPEPALEAPRPILDLSTVGGLIAIVLWSTTFAGARSLSEQVGSFTAAAAVYCTAGTICLARLFWAGNLVRRFEHCSRRYLFGCGSLFAVYALLIYLAVGLAQSREELLEIALLNYLWPAGTVLLSLPILREQASLWLVPGTALALIGVVLVMTQGASVSWATLGARMQHNPLPLLFAVTAAGCWALYSNLARLWGGGSAQGGVELFLPATGLFLVIVRTFWPEVSHWTLQAVFEAAALGAITALAYALWDAAMRKGNLSLVACSSYFTPLLSTLVSAVYLKVVPGTRLWVGSLLLVAGSLISWLAMRTGTPRPEKPD
jgi:drug/metabolite transporter (DMT)-like permease